MIHQPEKSSPRYLPLLLFLFAGSGCAALIYEIVWFQLLQLVIGSSAVSLGVLLGAFMGGMCAGSLALPRWIRPGAHPLRVYAALELGIGVLGVLTIFALPRLGDFYAANGGRGFAGILLRGAVCAVALAPSTFLLGATLPAISRWVEANPNGVSWLGFFYAGNTAGAVAGCLAAGFYLLRVHDMSTATYVAAAINGVVALTAYGLAAVTSSQAKPLATEEDAGRHSRPGTGRVYLAIGLSGMCALGAEVVWTRLLTLLIGATVYTFSIILAVFLAGIGIGGSAGAVWARGTERPGRALGWCQMLLAAAIAWAAWMLSESLPYWPINPTLSRSPWYGFQLDLIRCAWAILPATCLWGASFPLALAAVATGGKDPGRWVGRVYAANTLGAIAGAIGCSIVMVAWVGTQQTQRLLMGFSVLAGLVMWMPAAGSAAEARAAGRPGGGIVGKLLGAVGALIVVGLAGWLVWKTPKVSWELVAHGRYLPTKEDKGKLLYVGEGMNSSVAVTESDKVRYFHVSGKVEASSDPRDMRLQRMLGHIPALLHAQPQSVLVVGCGAGVTAGSFTRYPGVEKIVICEIEPLIPRAVASYFSNQNYSVVSDPRVTIVYDDARHYVLTTPEKFDIITSDPIHPWVKGAATLYTKEYFELCKRRLKPGGLVTQWVPLYESSLAVVKSEIATFFQAFPNGTIWSNDDHGAGYDVVLLGQADPMTIHVDDLQTRLDGPAGRAAADSLRDVGFKSAVELLGTYAGRPSDLGAWLKGAEVNRDANLRLQFLAGMGLNFYDEELIFSAMSVYRKYPEDLFAVSGKPKTALMEAIARSRTGK